MKVFGMLIILAMIQACGSADQNEINRSSPNLSQEDDGRVKRPSSRTNKDGPDEGQDSDGLDGGHQDTDGSPGDKPGTGGGNAETDKGAELFAQSILPLYKKQCVSCHADPRMPADLRGPLTVYSYSSMRALALKGAAAQDSDLIRKIRNVVTHGGGDRCTQGIEVSPCNETVAWIKFERGETEDNAPRGSYGKISSITALGRVYGWGVDPANTMTQVTVNFYLDGPRDTGTAIGSTQANRSGADGNTPGDHAFIFDVPEEYRDGKARELYAYAVVDGVEQAVDGAPFRFTAYGFSDAGRAYYEANVRGRLASCQGCHTVSYEQQFFSLIAPAPSEGGTATNNQMINKPAQINGVSHGGGLRCNGINAAPCAQLQEWWRIEFGGG